ncbi:MAG: hypothetical protein K9H16_06955 [Bacteroidales bacterium]|nr:hypothetical protein [Bacteroidales bacterium]
MNRTKMQLNQTLKAGLISIFLFTQITAITISAQSHFSDKVEKLWQSDAIFQVPESVYYEANEKMLFVANINGSPTDRDGNGFISQMEPDGRMVRLEWAAGLHAPKGMNSFKGKLYVADIYRVAEIDLKSRKILNFYDAGNAEFLNDVIADDEGTIYISDMARGSVYKLSEGKITEWIPAGTFESPNGMYYLDGMIYLGARGKIVSIDPATTKTETLAEFEGGVDGLEIDTKGNFIFSDWSGKVQKVSRGGKPAVLFNTTDNKINAADIHLIREDNILLVPTFFDNRVMAYKLLD